MKKLVAILLISELLIAYFILAPTCVLRQEQVRAFGAGHDHPTPASRAELDRQSRITESYRVGFSAVFFCVMAGGTLFAVRVWKQRHPLHPDLSDDKIVA
jgi:hypothetical protein